MGDALALVEVDSIAVGLRALDTLVKRAPVEVLEANLIEPGRYLILFAGGVAEVEESMGAVSETHGEDLTARMFLPLAHDALVGALRGEESRKTDQSLGVVEGSDVAGTLVACDRALKEASVNLCGIRVAVGLGGRAYFVVTGEQSDVEAAVEAGEAVLDDRGSLHRTEVIARPHAEMVTWLLRPAPFSVGG